ncbi:hypothetical protein SAMN05660209_03598 [Geodermatophilus africanus]|uniref:NurA domain-containing protein n=1 Tax=Geodermatophilus africanus TaxID=1137993 RepID=A0A1H3MAD9_9ACTN|nr:hypothetical protein [Geodermatophilus africanus]SDY72995.1 hypothetical protein SAMN05660209_03598 [Geodermatophilus africanus]
MPYEQERASRLGHLPIAQSPIVTEALARWDTPTIEISDPVEITQRTFDLTHFASPRRPATTHVMAFDGSNQEVEAKTKYPSVRVGFIQVGAVLLDLEKFLNSRDDGLVDARRLQRAQTTKIVNAVLPSSQVTRPGMSGVDSWRVELYETFCNQVVQDFGSDFSLIDALLTLHGTPGTPAPAVPLGRCPTCDDEGQQVTAEPQNCTNCQAPIYATDLLRTHEEYSEEGSNIEILTRTMNLAERLLTITYMDGFARTTPAVLGQLMFITDGPLAFFGPTAPLKRRMVNYWGSLCEALAKGGFAPPLVVGIEKSGAFVDHANALAEHMSPESVMVLDQKYIAEHVRRKASDSIYGKDEFYGRRFFYKSSTDQMIVATFPRIPAGQPYEAVNTSGGTNPAEQPSSYPTLRPTLEALDRLQTRLYPNAVIPVALAHSASSLPLGTGRSVLTLLAQDGLGLDRSSIGLARHQTYM